jgi:putative DNA primase/helicase
MGWIRHGVESAKFVFLKATDAADTVRINAAVKKIVEFLRLKGQSTRWQITSECFQGHASKAIVDAAIERLLLASPPQITVQTQPRARGARGPKTNSYALSAVR